MDQMRPSLRHRLRPLSRRLAAGLVLEIWPAWAIGGLLVAGLTALACRLFVPAAAPYLYLLWLAPIAASGPALLLCWRRRYREPELVAIADCWGAGAVCCSRCTNGAMTGGRRLRSRTHP